MTNKPSIAKNISEAQIFYTVLIIVVLVIAVWIYGALRARKAKRLEVESLINDFEKNDGEDKRISEEFDLPVDMVAKGRDIAFNVSILLETNEELTWWEKSKDNAWRIAATGIGAYFYSGVPQSNIDEAVQWLNKVRTREEAILVATLYEDFTGGNNLKLDIDKYVDVPDRRSIRSYRFFN